MKFFRRDSTNGDKARN